VLERIARRKLFVCLLFFLVVALLFPFVPDIAHLLQASFLSKIAESQARAYVAIVPEALLTLFALAFTISLLAIQQASDKYSPSLLKKYKKTPEVWAVIVVQLSTYFGSKIVAMLAIEKTWFLQIVTLESFSVVFVIYYYFSVADFINPVHILEGIREDAERILEEYFDHHIDSFGLRSTELVTYEPLMEKLRLIQHVTGYAFQNKVYETYRAGLQCLTELMKTYTSLRSEQIEQDDRLLHYVYEFVKTLTLRAIGEQETYMGLDLIKSIERIGAATTCVTTLDPDGASVLTGVSGHYMKELGLKAMEKSMSDLVAQAITSIKQVGHKAIAAKGDDSLSSKYIFDIGMASDDWFVVVNAYASILNLVIDATDSIAKRKAWRWTIIDGMFELIKGLSTHAVDKKIASHCITGPLFWKTSPTSIHTLTEHILAIIKGSYPQIETANREEFVRNVLDSEIELLEELGEVSKQRDRALLRVEVRTIDELLEIVRDIEFKTIEDYAPAQALQELKQRLVD